MPLHTVFCSANDRNVTIVLHSLTSLVGLPTEAGEVACFDQGVRCTGTLCPLCALPPDQGDRDEARRAGALLTN